jgi:hypothetical protein
MEVNPVARFRQLFEEEDERKRDIEQALAKWKAAERYFESVQDTDLMDFAIYEMEAARRKYVLLLRRYSQDAAAPD